MSQGAIFPQQNLGFIERSMLDKSYLKNLLTEQKKYIDISTLKLRLNVVNMGNKGKNIHLSQY